LWSPFQVINQDQQLYVFPTLRHLKAHKSKSFAFGAEPQRNNMDPLADSQFEDAEEGNPVNEWIGGMLAQGAIMPQHEQPDAQRPCDNVYLSTDTSDVKVRKPDAVEADFENDACSLSETLP
jgi:hypothetical protein